MLLESLIAVETRFKELNKSIEENIDDYQKVAELSKEKSDLEEIVEKSNFYRQTLNPLKKRNHCWNQTMRICAIWLRRTWRN